jgi:hypothetical protein
VTGPWIAATPGFLDAFLERVWAIGMRYCRYLGERDFRFGE